MFVRPRCVHALVLALLVASPGCQPVRRPAVGPNGEVTLVTDLPESSPAVAAAKAVLGRAVMTTRPEPAFELERVSGARFRSVRSWRNLVLLADLSTPGATTELVKQVVGKKLLSEYEAGRRFYGFYSDVWARGQTVLVLAGRGGESLAAALRAQDDALHAAFEQHVTRQILPLLYLSGEQDSFRRHLERTYGWSLRIPAGYRVGEDPEAHFVRLFMRDGGARLMFVHWQDGATALPTPAECIATRARLIAQFYDGDAIDSTRTHAEPADFLGRRAVKLVGVWQNEKYTMGGPFRTYCFFDAGRVNMIDLAVFDPVDSKVALLRELEAVALTYRDLRRSTRP
jgi:hypothetical protein